MNLRLSAGAIIIFLAVLCFAPGNVYAIPETFNISFDEGGGIVWTGTYTIDGGVLTEFSAEIGSCGVNCIYNNIFANFNNDPNNNDNSLTLIGSPTGGILGLVDFENFNLWFTANPFDVAHGGTYNSANATVPESSTLLLLGSGLLVVAYVARRRRGQSGK